MFFPRFNACPSPRGRVFTFDFSHLTWLFPGITTEKF
ncbi:MAG: hypothetical protein HYV01_05890 [Deltaproteobacteria bacterium]|nr:hypothetical protein [Deltaproteobacteria bacterium]